MKNWQSFVVLRAQSHLYDANEYEWKKRSIYTSPTQMKQL